MYLMGVPFRSTGCVEALALGEYEIHFESRIDECPALRFDVKSERCVFIMVLARGGCPVIAVESKNCQWA